jgi:16S rRNA processing protein RimM
MDLKDCFYLGKIGRPRSFRGEVNFIFDNDTPELYLDMKELLVLVGKKLVIYRVDHISLKNNGQGIIKFKGFNSKVDVDRIKNFEVYLSNEYLPELDEKDYYIHDLVGCMVIDENLGEIGTVREVNIATAQRLLMIGDEINEKIVPLIDQFVLDINKTEKIIKTNLPEGLLDLNE